MGWEQSHPKSEIKTIKTMWETIKHRIYLVLLFILGIIVPAVFESCDKPNVKTSQTEFKYGVDGKRVSKYMIEGHEYIGSLTSQQNDWATHSGTCPHPSHKCHTDTVYITVPADTVFCVITPSGSRILEKRK
jgi:hypothetical protein